MSPKVTLALVPREVSLTPSGVVAFGDVARALARHVLGRFEDFASLECVAADGLLVLLGEENVLPFVDGVIYVGAEAGILSVRVPTTHRTNVPLTLVDALLREQAIALPVVLVAREAALHVVPVSAARPLGRARLEAFVTEQP